ncbi:PREDICTED: E3 ubiquitin-protein ligase RNF115-like [Priapulus caudatus]|uniref:E3 ubiquitin-protein ligase RNF115-like n=1 Tax=Priapulus caudatus TaxID=37621 RepID=A0ABM1DWQ1_PRICU|nr:PREDICTED: E3 ubiquitin-protein ligase RNF115-like [Priapulus caudatus]
MPVFVNLHGNPGDYAWGPQGIDAIITQLLNQIDGVGPAPAPADAIVNLPSVSITQEQVDAAAQCSVCFEDFRLDEAVKKLPCEHCFHEECIVPWLKLHGTCPICRKVVATGEDGADAATAASDSDSFFEVLIGAAGGSNNNANTSTSSGGAAQRRGNSSNTDASNNEPRLDFIDEYD